MEQNAQTPDVCHPSPEQLAQIAVLRAELRETREQIAIVRAMTERKHYTGWLH